MMDQSFQHPNEQEMLATQTNTAEFTPTCSVVICTRNRPAELDRCLAAVVGLSYPCMEVLVVDNAPSDRRAEEVSRRWGVRYLVDPVPGLSHARNTGGRTCRSEIVAYIDDDAIPEPDWLAALAVEFRDPLVMAAAGERLPLKIETEAERLCNWVSDRRAWCVVDRQTPFWFEIANFGGIGTGMNMAFRRRAFDFWPGFHERLGRGAMVEGGEEHYAFFSLIDRGYRAVHTPRALVRHPFPSTMQALRDRQIKNLAAAVGYCTLLFVEEPRHRGAVVKYAVEAMRGTPRVWRTAASRSACLVPWWRGVVARLRGPLMYLWSRLTERVSRQPLPQLIADRSLPLDPARREATCGPKSAAR